MKRWNLKSKTEFVEIIKERFSIQNLCPGSTEEIKWSQKGRKKAQETISIFFYSSSLMRIYREETERKRENEKNKEKQRYKSQQQERRTIKQLHREHRSSVSDFHRGFTKRVERSQKARRNASEAGWSRSPASGIHGAPRVPRSFFLSSPKHYSQA